MSGRAQFYAGSVVHIRALSNAVNLLFDAHRLSARRQIVLTHSDADSPDTKFSLESDPPVDNTLSEMHGDLRVMAPEPAQQFWFARDALAAQAR